MYLEWSSRREVQKKKRKDDGAGDGSISANQKWPAVI
jgi:hypothetical protein